jgi:hypothetical protein
MINVVAAAPPRPPIATVISRAESAIVARTAF